LTVSRVLRRSTDVKVKLDGEELPHVSVMWPRVVPGGWFSFLVLQTFVPGTVRIFDRNNSTAHFRSSDVILPHPVIGSSCCANLRGSGGRRNRPAGLAEIDEVQLDASESEFFLQMRLSSLRYSITFCCCQFIQFASAPSKMCLESLTIRGILTVRPANARIWGF